MCRTVVLLVATLFGFSVAQAQKPNLKLPFSAGESWQLTRGYGGSTHQDYGPWMNDSYALDFAQQECGSWQKSILATAFGTVLKASDDGGWGLTVIIDHGGGYRSRYSHLDSVSVQPNQEVYQGQEVGKCGNSGTTEGETCPEHPGTHLHFALYYNGVAELPEPMSGHTDFTPGVWYTSDNYSSKGYWQDGTLHQQIRNKIDSLLAIGTDIGRPFDNGGGLFVHSWFSQNGSTYVEIQDFYNSETGEYYAIIYDPVSGVAYLVKGGFRWYYTSVVDGPAELGPPVSDEYIHIDKPYINGQFDQNSTESWIYVRQDFTRNGRYLLWKYGNPNIFAIDPTGAGGPDFTTAILPGDGDTLLVETYALSHDRIYVTSNKTIAAHYDVYLSGQWVGELQGSNLEFVVSGLSPSTTYTIKVVTVDINNTVLDQSDEVSVTTPAEPIGPQPNVEILDLVMWVRNNQIEVGIPNPIGASSAYVQIDGISYPVPLGTFWFSPNLTNGTHTVLVKIYNVNGVLIAQTLSREFQIGILYSTTFNGPAVIGPNHSGEIVFTFKNGSNEWVTNFQYLRVQSTSPEWLIPLISNFPDPGSVAPGAEVDIVVPFITANYYFPIGSVAISIYAEAARNSGGLIPKIASVCDMEIARFKDLEISIVQSSSELSENELGYVVVNIEALCNDAIPSARLEAKVDGFVVTSVLIPELTARQIFQIELPIGQHQPGHKTLTVEVDPGNVIAEADEDNNSWSTVFDVIPTPKPNLNIIIDIDGVYYIGDTAIGTGFITNNGDVDSGRCEYLITDGITTLEGSFVNVAAGQTISWEFSLPFMTQSNTTITATVDHSDIITESNETDNDFVVIVMVLPLPDPEPELLPDLLTENVGFSFSQKGRNSTIFVDVFVRNSGGVNATSFIVQLNVAESGKTFTAVVNSLAPGESVVVSFSDRLRKANKATLTIRVDPNDQVTELDETNNLLEVSYTL